MAAERRADVEGRGKGLIDQVIICKRGADVALGPASDGGDATDTVESGRTRRGFDGDLSAALGTELRPVGAMVTTLLAAHMQGLSVFTRPRRRHV